MLLVHLATASRKKIARAHAFDLLWPDDFYDAGRLRLRQEISRLRSSLGPLAKIVCSDTDFIWLDTSSIEIDLDEFLNSNRKARVEANPALRENLLRRAVDLAVEPFLDGFGDEWVQAERARIEEVLYTALIDLCMRLTERREHAGALELAHRAHRLRPDREAPLTISEAVLFQLDESLHNARQDRAVVSVPEVSSARFHLTAPEEAIYGRENELKLATARLDPSNPNCRLLMLSGPGGIGKTRLLQELALQLKPVYSNRVAFVDLTDVEDPNLVPIIILRSIEADAIAVREPLKHLAQVLPNEPTLLLLDNLEQIPGLGPVLRDLLQSKPNLRIAASSRTVLNIAGESRLMIGPLALPDPTTDLALVPLYPAVRVFTEAAAFSGVTLPTDSSSWVSIASIVRRLDGVPLALQLAAARTRAIGLQELDERLQFSHDLLTSRREDAPERHRSMSRVVESSFEALPKDLQGFLTALAVFRGGWTLQSAAEVGQITDPLDAMESLLDASLIHVAQESRRIRFRMLEVIRQFLRERTPNETWAPIQERHAAWMQRLAKAAAVEYAGESTAKYFEELELEGDNLREALRHSLESDPSLALEFGANVAFFWRYRTNGFEGKAFYRDLFAQHGNLPSTELTARAAYGQAIVLQLSGGDGDTPQLQETVDLCLQFGLKAQAATVCACIAAWNQYNIDYESVDRELVRARSLLDDSADPSARAFVESIQGMCAHYQGRAEEAVELLQSAVRTFDAAGEVYYRCRIRQLFVLAALEAGEIELAASVNEGLMDAVVAAGLRALAPLIHHGQACLEFKRGNYQAAIPLFEASLVGWRERKLSFQIGDEINHLGRVAFAMGDLTEARARFIDAAQIWFEIGRPVAASTALVGLAGVELQEQNFETAARLFGVSKGEIDASGARLIRSESNYMVEIERQVRKSGQDHENAAAGSDLQEVMKNLLSASTE